MGAISLIIPEATENLVFNPSLNVGLLTDWQVYGAPLVFRISDEAAFGPFCVYVEGNLNQGFQQNLSGRPTVGEIYTASVWVNPIAGTVRFRHWDGVAYTTATSTGTGWQRLEIQVTAAANFRVEILGNEANSRFFVDAIQVEEKSYATTYCDGDIEGCAWVRVLYQSSYRSPDARGGGREINLDVYNISVSKATGIGMPPHIHNVHQQALRPGAFLQSVKIQPRLIQLGCFTRTRTESTKYISRDQLIDALKIDRVATLQPFTLRYLVEDTTIETDVYYDAGLEANFEIACSDRFILRLVSYDPFWYELVNDSKEVAPVTFLNPNHIIAYIDGIWTDMGPPSSIGGATINVWVIKRDPVTGDIYVGGQFTNWDGLPAGDYIVMWDGTGWNTVGGGVNEQVHAIEFASDGTIYVGGNFTNAGGPTGDYFCTYDRVSNTFTPVAGGGTGRVRTISIGHDGIIYLGGSFQNWDGDGNSDRIVQWDGTSYSPLLTGCNNTVHESVILPTGDLIIVGSFTDAGGVADTNRVAGWDGTTFYPLFEGMDGTVYDIAISEDGTIYIAGSFTSIFGGAAGTHNRVAMWNGSTWQPMGDGFNDTVREIKVGPDGRVFASGDFTEVEGGEEVSGVAVWNGSIWVHTDVEFTPDTDIKAIEFGLPDPVISQNYDLYFGFDRAGPAAVADRVIVTNEGSAEAYPVTIITSSGAAMLKSLRNYTTGRNLLFNLPILPDERITITLVPGERGVESDWRGNLVGNLLPNSDFATFSLKPGPNVIECFVMPECALGSGIYIPSGCIGSGIMWWRNTHWSIDGVI